jgi:hypothetical protein
VELGRSTLGPPDFRNDPNDSDVAGCKRCRCWAFEHFAVDVEAGAVTGAIPAAFCAVESDEATEVGATQRNAVEITGCVAVDTDFAQATLQDAGFAGGNVFR